MKTKSVSLRIPGHTMEVLAKIQELYSKDSKTKELKPMQIINIALTDLLTKESI